jgi:hypothetical protein
LYAHAACSVVNCVLDSNTTYGLLKHMACGDTVRDNSIMYNATGIAHDFSGCGGTVYIFNNQIKNNSVGVLLQNMGGSQTINIYNNCICTNTTYNFQNLTAINVNASNNNWCSSNTAYIQASIYDAYDNVSYGIVNYSPINTTLCSLITGVEEQGINSGILQIYPIPAQDQIIIESESDELQSVYLYDVNGKCILSNDLKDKVNKVNIEDLSEGIYGIIIRSKDCVISRKIVKTK